MEKMRSLGDILFSLTLVAAAATLSSPAFAQTTGTQGTSSKPNCIFILADDMGWGDVGCNGQTQFHTPNIDRMAAEGIRFTSAYAGSPLCAPCRGVLMTGLHSGHGPIRQNPAQARGYNRTMQGDPPLSSTLPTLAKVFKQAGYNTAVIGKWGLGRAEGEGSPKSAGFDYFFGYDSHVAAHDYYPGSIWRNNHKVPLDKKTYSHDLFTTETLQFVRQEKDNPFFLYLAYTIPHVPLNPPSDAPYSDEPWPKAERAHAAMIHRMDADIGRLLALLKELKIDENTLVVFTSDNGPTGAGGHKPAYFKSNGPFRGQKNGPYEGGIRVPFVARWPAKIPAGHTTDHPIAFYDVLATSAEIAGVAPPEKTDGISFLPTLAGNTAKQKAHEYLYWELGQVDGGHQGIRMGDWKAERLDVTDSKHPRVELYDLKKDIGQKRNVAADNPDVVQRIEKIAEEAHTTNLMFPLTYEEAQAAPPKGVRRGKQAE